MNAQEFTIERNDKPDCAEPRPIRVLLVEDDEDDFVMTRDLLRRCNLPDVDLTWVAEYDEALQQMISNHHDACLVDFRLGIHDGIELIRSGIEGGGRGPFILVSGHTASGLKLKATQIGATDFLTKDELRPELLGRVVRYAIDSSHALQELKMKQAELCLLLDSLPTALVGINKEGHISRWNTSAEQLFDISATNALGKDFCNLPIAWDDDSLGRIEDEFNSDKLEKVSELRFQDNELTERVLRATINPICREMAGETRWIALFEDMTEQVNLQEQLRQSQKMEAIGALAGGVAHEFNNLLQAIRGYAEFARSSLPPECPAEDDLNQLMKATLRAADLTKQLLGFGRRHSLVPRPISMNTVIGDLLKLLRPLLSEDIEIETSLESEIHTVHADAALIQQMLMNLCVNARDAMPEGGNLLIRTKNTTLDKEFCEIHGGMYPGHYVMISITDTGTGMSNRVKERVFEPFFTTKEVGRGTGLGLAMVYGVIKQHAGHINVYSEPGEGTTFRLYLPAVDGQPAEVAPADQGARIGGTETILFAEDDALVRSIGVRILEAAGYHVLVAKDGSEAIRILDNHAESISLALLDIVMPKVSGREVMSHIRKNFSHIRVVFCSGYDPGASQANFVVEEQLPLVEKPFDATVLLRTVRTALDSRPHTAPGNYVTEDTEVTAILGTA